MIKEILADLPTVVGHRRVWMAMKRRGVLFYQGTAYRIIKELGFLVPKRKGRCKKKYKAIQVENSNEVGIADTTIWSAGRNRVEIYVCLDAYSR